jgi:adenylate kinase family enzyme
VKRISIVGNSGTGKTTLARRLASTLHVDHVELDALFHQPGWTESDPEDFRARVAARLDAADGWVTCGNYRSVLMDTVWSRADTVVWLDLPRPTVMRRVTTRTLRRVIKREELWNGNREPWTNLYAWDPERNIIRWAWTQHQKYVERYEGEMRDPAWSHLTFVRLRRPAAVDEWLAGLTTTR